MLINGKDIASKIYDNLKNRVGELQKKGVTPQLTVILAGEDPASMAYVKQKQKWGEYIGAKITLLRYPSSIPQKVLEDKIQELNKDPKNHAILIQRPLPPQINISKIEKLVGPQKDIDGYHPDSPYTLPLPLAVVKILEEIHLLCHSERPKGVEESHQVSFRRSKATDLPAGEAGKSSEAFKKHKRSLHSSDDSVGMTKEKGSHFLSWLKTQKIALLGKGPTGGGPIINYLNKLNIKPTLIDSKTQSPDKILKSADIIISAIGKPNILTAEKIKQGVILIGVGIFRGDDGKLCGDYNEEKISKKAKFYTPTPGGVGPVNVAMLMENLLDTTDKQSIKLK